MIRLRFFTRKEREKYNGIFVRFDREHFRELVEHPAGYYLPDEADHQFLELFSKESGYEIRIDPEDPYSVIEEGQRYALADIAEEAAYGLLVLSASKSGWFVSLMDTGLYAKSIQALGRLGQEGSLILIGLPVEGIVVSKTWDKVVSLLPPDSFTVENPVLPITAFQPSEYDWRDDIEGLLEEIRKRPIRMQDGPWKHYGELLFPPQGKVLSSTQLLTLLPDEGSRIYVGSQSFRFMKENLKKEERWIRAKILFHTPRVPVFEGNTLYGGQHHRVLVIRTWSDGTIGLFQDEYESISMLSLLFQVCQRAEIGYRLDHTAGPGNTRFVQSELIWVLQEGVAADTRSYALCGVCAFRIIEPDMGDPGIRIHVYNRLQGLDELQKALEPLYAGMSCDNRPAKLPSPGLRDDNTLSSARWCQRDDLIGRAVAQGNPVIYSSRYMKTGDPQKPGGEEYIYAQVPFPL